MNRQECIEGISSQLAQLVNALLDASGQWEQEQWLATAEHETGAIATALGQMILQALVDRHGTGHGGPYHTDAQGQRRKFKEYRGRTIKTRLGDIRLRRAVYWSSSAVPTAIVPLDVTLGQDDELSPALQEAIAFTASQLTYEETVHLVKKLVGVDVSAGKVQTVTTQWGQRALQQRAQHLPAELPSERMAVVVDGTMVRTATRTRVAPPSRRQAFSEHWRETKLGAIYSFDQEGRAHRDKRYTASLQGKDTFGQRLWDQIEASKAHEAPVVVWLGDGAEWVWRLKEEHLPHAVEILDFHHARITSGVWPSPRGAAAARRCDDGPSARFNG